MCVHLSVCGFVQIDCEAKKLSAVNNNKGRPHKIHHKLVHTFYLCHLTKPTNLPCVC